MVTLRTETIIFAPPAKCFDLTRSIELHAASASIIHGKAMAGRTSGLATLGDRTKWSARFFGMRLSLTTEITAFDRPCRFSDMQCAGLFAHFGHVYTFKQIGPMQTVMTDEFSFQSPLGVVGAVFDNFVLRRRMRTILEFRALFLRRVAESDEWRVYLQNAEEYGQEGTP